MMKLGILCSGNLGLTILKYAFENYEIKFVLTDKSSSGISNFAKKNEIALFEGNPRKGKGYNYIKRYNVDIIASINYLFLIEEDIINHSKKITFNIHGALLPKYRGRTPHVWSIINGEKEAGITAHLIDSDCDSGDILFQEKIIIEKNDTGADILDKYKELYIPIFERTISAIEKDNIVTLPQDESKATYYGKRTPDDGHINWNWQKERIRNWVRAQSYPYPGAFTFYENRKVIVDEIEFVDEGYRFDVVNGTIISVIPFLVKTPNGIVKLSKIREKDDFKKFKVLT